MKPDLLIPSTSDAIGVCMRAALIARVGYHSPVELILFDLSKKPRKNGGKFEVMISSREGECAQRNIPTGISKKDSYVCMKTSLVFRSPGIVTVCIVLRSGTEVVVELERRFYVLS